MRYRRSKQIFDLGAPSIIIQNELRWLLIMIDHMNKRLEGIEPQFTEEQLEELKSLAEAERAFKEE